MRQALLAAALLAASCAPADAPEPVTVPAAQPDPRIAEMQVAMTELLERLDVMSQRIAHLEETRSAAAAPRGGATADSRPASPSAVPQRPDAPAVQRAVAGADLADDYRAAMSLYGRGSFAEARKAFEAIFAADENGDLADNALFWIGETYFSTGDYTSAMRYYQRIVSDYGEENKAPDALLKTGMAIAKTGDLALARRTFQQVIANYPYSTAASTAKAELQRIRF